MPGLFDPYHRWLGIPPKHQPPNCYRLLGLELYEDDAEVIRDAAAQRIAHVRTYQLGQYSDLSQRILNELAAARACLLDPEKKPAYDRDLRDGGGIITRSAEPPSLPEHGCGSSPTDRGESFAGTEKPGGARRKDAGYGRRYVTWLAMLVAAGALAVGQYRVSQEQREALAAKADAKLSLERADAATRSLQTSQKRLAGAREDLKNERLARTDVERELARKEDVLKDILTKVADLKDGPPATSDGKQRKAGAELPKLPETGRDKGEDKGGASDTGKEPPRGAKAPQSPYKSRVLPGRCCAAFSPDGREILTGGRDGSIIVWDAATGAKQETIVEVDRGRAVQCVAFSIQGDMIAVARCKTKSPIGPEIALWKTKIAGHPAGGRRVWSPDLRNSVHSSRSTLGLRNVVLGGPVGGHVVLAELGRRGWAGNPTSIVRLSTTGTVLAEFPPRGALAEAIALSTDGQRALAVIPEPPGRLIMPANGPAKRGSTAGPNPPDQAVPIRRVEVWEVDTCSLLNTFRISGQAVVAAKFSPDGQYILTQWADGTASLWMANSGAFVSILRTTNATRMTCAAVDIGGQTVLAGFADGSVEVWNAVTAKMLDRISAHVGAVASGGFSRDGKRAFTVSLQGNSVAVWDLAAISATRESGAKESVDARGL
jgi:WD40 repeat protein